jgi:hypothetical protein
VNGHSVIESAPDGRAFFHPLGEEPQQEKTFLASVSIRAHQWLNCGFWIQWRKRAATCFQIAA